MQKAWSQGPVDFFGAPIHLYPDLSRNTLHMHMPSTGPHTATAGTSYTWGHPFSIEVTRGDGRFMLSDPDQLPGTRTGGCPKLAGSSGR